VKQKIERALSFLSSSTKQLNQKKNKRTRESTHEEHALLKEDLTKLNTIKTKHKIIDVDLE